MLILGLLPPIRSEDLFLWGELTCVQQTYGGFLFWNKPKWLFGRKRLPSPEFFGHMIKNNF